MNQVSGQRLKQARQLRGLTLQRVADLIHKPKRVLVRYETELEQPLVETLERLAIVLGFPIGFFRQGDPPSFNCGSMIFHYRFEPSEDWD